jgi:hypothetical protein
MCSSNTHSFRNGGSLTRIGNSKSGSVYKSNPLGRKTGYHTAVKAKDYIFHPYETR